MLIKITKPARLAIPVFALLTLALLSAAFYRINRVHPFDLQQNKNPEPGFESKTRFRYDEMAHKLVIEYSGPACDQLNKQIASGFGNALRNVSRQISNQEAIVEM